MKLLLTAQQFSHVQTLLEIMGWEIEIVATPTLTDGDLVQIISHFLQSMSNPNPNPLEDEAKESLSDPELPVHTSSSTGSSTESDLQHAELSIIYGSAMRARTVQPEKSEHCALFPKPPVELEPYYFNSTLPLFQMSESSPFSLVSFKLGKINLKHLFVLLTMIRDIIEDPVTHGPRLPKFLAILDDNYLDVLPESFATEWKKTPYAEKKTSAVIAHICLIMELLLSNYEPANDTEKSNIHTLTEGLMLIRHINQPELSVFSAPTTAKDVKKFAQQFGAYALREAKSMLENNAEPTAGRLFFSQTVAKGKYFQCQSIVLITKLLRTLFFNTPYHAPIENEKRPIAPVPAAARLRSKRIRRETKKEDEEITLNLVSKR